MLKKIMQIFPVMFFLLTAVHGLAIQPTMPANEAEKKILDVIEDMKRNQSDGMMNVPEEDGRLLRLYAETTCAKHVVEIGTGSGYSGLWFCLGLRNTGGQLITYEIDARRASLARENFERAGVDRMVRLIEGDAHETVKQLYGSIDILFLDADKDGYIDYLNKLLPLVRPGGLILSHNVDDAGEDFIKAITTNPDLETVFQGEGQRLGVTLKKRPLLTTTIMDVGVVLTPYDVVNEMLKLAEVNEDDVVYDLGCGDGRIVVAAAKKYGCKAVGYDTDPVCVKKSRENAEKDKVSHLVKIEQKDIFTADLSGASVITLFLNPRVNLKLVPQFEKLKPGSRIVSHTDSIEGTEPDKIVKVFSNEVGREYTLYLWKMPFKKTKEVKLELTEEDAQCPWCGSPRR